MKFIFLRLRWCTFTEWKSEAETGFQNQTCLLRTANRASIIAVKIPLVSNSVLSSLRNERVYIYFILRLFSLNHNFKLAEKYYQLAMTVALKFWKHAISSDMKIFRPFECNVNFQVRHATRISSRLPHVRLQLTTCYFIRTFLKFIFT